jgi:hypothetical protein
MPRLEHLRPSGLHHNPAYSHVVVASGARTIYIALRFSPADCCRTRFHLAIDCMKARSSLGSAAVQTGSSPGSGSTWPNSIICRGANSLM